jgi:hypothetical protein
MVAFYKGRNGDGGYEVAVGYAFTFKNVRVKVYSCLISENGINRPNT